MKRILTFLFLLVSIGLRAQFPDKPANSEKSTVAEPPKSGIVFMFGPSANYFLGEYSNTDNNFDKDILNVQLNGFIGYNSPLSKAKNSLGIFGTAGYTNKTSFQKMTEVQGLQTGELVINKFYTFYQVEAGMLLGNALRLSTGYGRQEFETVDGFKSFDYYSTTAGLFIDLGPFYWNIEGNLNYGRDYPKTTLKLVTGFMILF